MPMMTSSSIELGQAKIYTMRELNQNTAQVIDEVNRSGQPAAVTKHGRFIALITPLAGAQIESMVLSHGKLADELHRRATDTDQGHHSVKETTQRVQSHYHGRD